jgi:hypothetical protein
MMLKTGIDTAFVAWERTIDQLFHCLTIKVPTSRGGNSGLVAHRGRVDEGDAGDISIHKTLENKVDLPAHVIKLWFHQAEQIVELMLLSARPPGWNTNNSNNEVQQSNDSQVDVDRPRRSEQGLHEGRGSKGRSTNKSPPFS